MPRANRRRPQDASPPLDLGRALSGAPRRESHPDGEWFTRVVAARSDPRRYVCPGCQQAVGADTSHTVAWPADGIGGVDVRRHWHTVCWQARCRRPPRGSSR